jgi:hypothetical protein
MARLLRKRRILKWAGLVLSLLIAIAWVMSIPWWWAADYHTVDNRINNPTHRTYRCGSGGGCVFAAYNSTTAPTGGRWKPSSPRLNLTRSGRARMSWIPDWSQWSSTYRSYTRYHWSMGLPLWMLFLLSALPTAFLWWRGRRRIPPGHCRNCGYNLAGNVSGVCPECGERT